MTQLKIAAIYAAVNILLLLVLAVRTARNRQIRKVVLGDGGDLEMQRIVRAHANASEYVPAGLVGVTLLALFGEATPLWLLHAAGGSLTVGRIAHAIGLWTGPLNLGRVLGITLTWISFLVMGVGLIWLSVTERF